MAFQTSSGGKCSAGPTFELIFDWRNHSLLSSISGGGARNSCSYSYFVVGFVCGAAFLWRLHQISFIEFLISHVCELSQPLFSRGVGFVVFDYFFNFGVENIFSFFIEFFVEVLDEV